MTKIRVIDSHTGGEPTRVVLDHPLPGDTMADRVEALRRDYDELRAGIVCEPRGSDILVGAWLTPPVSPDAVAGIVFFNTVGALGMCGHGLIGVVQTLCYLRTIRQGEHKFDTPVGHVTAWLADDGSVTIENVVSRRHQARVSLEVPGVGSVTGDVAYGGNWFFLVHGERDVREENRHDLLLEAVKIKSELARQGLTGDAGVEIDHVEFFGRPQNPENDSRNFVLCPGNAYDRSPCGTGTSAKLACLAADGILAPGETWRQESITGSVFHCSHQTAEGGIVPRITGRAHVVAESELIFLPDDPLTGGRLG